MRGYAELAGCRRRYILNYLGQEYEGPCGRCDNDLLGRSGAEDAPAGAPFSLGQAVSHQRWGAGTVQRVTGESVTVLFEAAGYKVLALDLVQDQDLLQARSASDKCVSATAAVTGASLAGRASS